MKEKVIAPQLRAPPCGEDGGEEYRWEEYTKFIDSSLPPETPMAFGMHANAEIGFLTSAGERLFGTILRLTGGGGGSDDSGGGGRTVMTIIDELMDKSPGKFDMMILNERAGPLMLGPLGPYTVVALQECERMNALLGFIGSTLDELQKGLNGQLNVTPAMDGLATALSLDEVPGRDVFALTSWEKRAWPSEKSLGPWFDDVIARGTQLRSWSNAFALPFSAWISGLFNPTALLTAVKQVVARRGGLPLDNMAIETHCTRMFDSRETVAAARYPDSGAFLHGLYLQGARWADSSDPEGMDKARQTLFGVECGGCIMESRLKELLPAMPVLYARAVEVQPDWDPTALGYLRPEPTIYNCPVYTTGMRGPTFVFPATLRTINGTAPWVLAGVAMLMQTPS